MMNLSKVCFNRHSHQTAHVLYSTTPRRDCCHPVRWLRTQGHKLGNKPNGHGKGDFEESIRAYRHCQGTWTYIRMYNNNLGLQVDGVLWDLERPLEKPCKLELLDFEHPEGIPHSSRSTNTLTSSRRKESFLAFIRPCPR